MRPFIKFVALLLLAAAIPAVAVVMPMRIPFQGKLIDPATNNPKNGPIPMVFKIWDAPIGGNQLFSENQTVTAVNGVFSAQIGTVTYLNADILSGTSAYLGVTVVGDPEMLPRPPLSMSPYAYTAVQLASDKVIRINSGITYSTFTADGNLTLQYGIVGTTGTFTGNTFSVGGSSFTVGGGSATVAYRLTAGSFVGDGSGLTNLSGSINGNTFSVGVTSFTVGGGSATVGYGLTAGSYLATGPNGWFVGSSSITTTGGLFGASAVISGNTFNVGATTFTVAGGSATVGYGLTAGSHLATGPNGWFVGSSSITTTGGLFGASAVISGNTFNVGATTFTVAGGSATVGYGLTAGSYLATGPNGWYVGSSSITTTGGLFGASAVISGNTFNVGAASFTVAGGSATVGYGLTAGSVLATTVDDFGVVASSGIRIALGTLKLAAASRGIDASGTGIVATTATFATVTSTGINTYSIVSSSGIRMALGTLALDAASRGIDATGTGIIASTGVFTSSVTAKQFFGIGATTAAIKAADVSRTNSTLADDNELAIPIGANESYTAYTFFKSSSSSVTPDFKFAFTSPAGCAFDFGCHANNATAASANMFAMRDSGIASPPVLMGASIVQPVICVGSIVNGGTAGFFKLQWAQNTTNGTATTLTAGSFIAATRIK